MITPKAVFDCYKMEKYHQVAYDPDNDSPFTS